MGSTFCGVSFSTASNSFPFIVYFVQLCFLSVFAHRFFSLTFHLKFTHFSSHPPSRTTLITLWYHFHSTLSQTIHHTVRVWGEQFRRWCRSSQLFRIQGRFTLENQLEFSRGRLILSHGDVHFPNGRADKFFDYRFIDGCSFRQLHMHSRKCCWQLVLHDKPSRIRYTGGIT